MRFSFLSWLHGRFLRLVNPFQKTLGEQAWKEYDAATTLEERNAVAKKYAVLAQAEIEAALNGGKVSKETKKAVQKARKNRK